MCTCEGDADAGDSLTPANVLRPCIRRLGIIAKIQECVCTELGKWGLFSAELLCLVITTPLGLEWCGVAPIDCVLTSGPRGAVYVFACRMLKAQKAFEEDEEKVARLVKGFKTERVYHTDRWVSPSGELMQNKH